MTMKRIADPLLFLCLALMFWGTGIENRTEADDAYDYALQLEQGYPNGIYHPHHLLFGTVMRPAYHLATWLGYDGRAIGFMVLMSALCAAATACLFRGICRLHLNLGQMESLLATGFLVFSYGFWRYATEAEIIMPACAAILAAATMTLGNDRGCPKIAAAGAIAGFSATIHILNCIPAFGALPLLFLLRGQIRPLLIFGTAAVSAAGLPYLLVYSLARDQVPMDFFPPAGGDDRLGISILVKGAIGFGQCLISGNFLFGFESFCDKMVALFPARMLEEEIYMGRALSGARTTLATITALLFAITFATGASRAIANWRLGSRREHDGGRGMATHGWTPAFAISWFAAYATVILLMQPGNPEVWVMGLVPFWLALAGAVIAPPARDRHPRIAVWILVSLALHNYVGGIAILQDPRTDYNRRKAAWLLENASASDLILTAANPVFVRYLRYHSGAAIHDLNAGYPEEAESRLREAPRVLVLDDVFEYLPSMRALNPEQAERVQVFAAKLRGRAERIHDDDCGGVWRLLGPDDSKGARSTGGPREIR